MRALEFTITVRYGTDDASNFARGMATPQSIIDAIKRRQGVHAVEIERMDERIPIEQAP